MGLRGGVVLGTFVALAPATAALGATLRVNETATLVRTHDDRFDVRLVVENAAGTTIEADAEVDLLDPSDTVRAESRSHLTIGPGLQPLDVALQPGLSALPAAERLRILHYRLRYRLTLDPPPTGGARELTGVMAVSRLMPDVFELQLLSSDSGQAGRPLHIVVQAVHPVTSLPVSGVSVQADLALDEERHRTLSSTRVTDASGLAVLELPVPRDIETGHSAGLEVVGRKAGFTAEVSSDVQLLRFASVAVSTDKPLYQPGQVLHIRALARGSDGGPALADLPLEVKVSDEEGDAVFEATLRTSRFGIVSTDWPLPEHARLGLYLVSVEADEDAGIQGTGGIAFKLSRYEMPQFAVRAVPDRPYYLAGEQPRVDVRADYVFGKSVARGRARVVLESRREWNFKQQRWDVEERESHDGPLSESGTFSAAFDLDAKEDFPSTDDRWSPYRDIEGTAYVTDSTTGRTEEGRFTLRATRDPIHLYLLDRYAEPCPDEERRTCRASFYVRRRMPMERRPRARWGSRGSSAGRHSREPTSLRCRASR